jgi:hypothetical protein
MKHAFRLIVASVLAANAAQSGARNWVQTGTMYWIDLESVRRSGDLVYFAEATEEEGYTPPDNPEFLGASAFNCRTRYMYKVVDGQAQLQKGYIPAPEYADVYARHLCR